MRTTVEITSDQHEALSALARRRRLRGFSAIVQEALDSYLRDLSSEEIDFLLGLEGSMSDEEERQLRKRMDETRGAWRAS